MMRIGYARVSTFEQELNLQMDALKAAGCEEIFCDQGESGSKSSRPEWDKCLVHLRKGDTLVVWKLDRASRSTIDLMNLSSKLKEKGIDFKSIQEEIDTSSAMGEFFFTVMAGIAQLERGIIKERTLAGLAAARARGREGGRKKTIKKGQELEAKRLADAGDLSVTEICEHVGISRSSYYRLIA